MLFDKLIERQITSKIPNRGMLQARRLGSGLLYLTNSFYTIAICLIANQTLVKQRE